MNPSPCNDQVALCEGVDPFTCSLPAGHTGDHAEDPESGLIVSWPPEQPAHPDDWNLDLGICVCLDNDHRVISIHKSDALAQRHGWRLWRNISGLPHITMHVQQSLAPQIRRGVKLDGTSPYVEIVDRRPKGKAFAVWDGE